MADMKLKKLLKDIEIEVRGSRDVEITGVSSNSKVVGPGNLFVAKCGLSVDGTRFIPEAIAGGAVAVLTDLYDPSLKGVVQLVHPNVRRIEAELADAYYQAPSRDLFVVGITGTSGKTTTTFLVKYLLDSLGSPCGLIGTIEYLVGTQRYEASHTSPDVITTHKLLREMLLQRCRAVVMEVSSHALDQGRTDRIDFDVAIFTNLARDHLDYHKTREAYALAKAKLFRELGLGNKKREKGFPLAIVNRDDPWHETMLQDYRGETLTYGLTREADVCASEVVILPEKTCFRVTYQGQSYAFTWPLVGRFNIYNGLAAIALGLRKGQRLETLATLFSSTPQIAGRMDRVPNSLGIHIYVDYAHKPDALRSVLECLREIGQGRIFTVFGCGGDRDRGKRIEMAKTSEELSDFTVVTTDNPRSEEPASICQEIVQGFTSEDRYVVELDRREAISKALVLARPGDTILIAGKGHEKCQKFQHLTVAFDDKWVAQSLCQQMAHR